MVHKLEYSFAETPFGEVVAFGAEGRICALEFTSSALSPASEPLNSYHSSPPSGRAGVVAELRSMLAKVYPHYEIIEAGDLAQKAVDYFIAAGQPYLASQLLLHGTDFQQRVWRALLSVEFGATISYSQLAVRAGQPTAVRAVASAVARNPISLLIPCHRIIRNDGSTGEFRWGAERKRAILEWERLTAGGKQ